MRSAYWTILIGTEPTAFRAKDAADLKPTLVQLKRAHPDAVMKWYQRGKVWASPEEAQAEGRRARDAKPRETRDRNWRPGGTHVDPKQRFKDARKAKWQAFKDRQRSFGARRDERPPRAEGDGERVAPATQPLRPREDRPFRPEGDRPFKPAGRPSAGKPPFARPPFERPARDRDDVREGDRPERAARPDQESGERRTFKPGGKPPFKPSGFKPGGFKPGGFKSGGFKPAGKRPPFKPGGFKPASGEGRSASFDRPRSDREDGERRTFKPGGKPPFKPSGFKPGGFKPAGTRSPFKPSGFKPASGEGRSASFDRPRSDREDGERRPFKPGGKPPFKPSGVKPGGFKSGGFKSGGFKPTGRDRPTGDARGSGARSFKPGRPAGTGATRSGPAKPRKRRPEDE